jgi:hypothetical protein
MRMLQDIFHGIDVTKNPKIIGEFSSPDCQNVRIDNPTGSVNSQVGQTKLNPTSVGSPITSLHQLPKWLDFAADPDSSFYLTGVSYLDYLLWSYGSTIKTGEAFVPASDAYFEFANTMEAFNPVFTYNETTGWFRITGRKTILGLGDQGYLIKGKWDAVDEIQQNISSSLPYGGFIFSYSYNSPSTDITYFNADGYGDPEGYALDTSENLTTAYDDGGSNFYGKGITPSPTSGNFYTNDSTDITERLGFSGTKVGGIDINALFGDFSQYPGLEYDSTTDYIYYIGNSGVLKRTESTGASVASFVNVPSPWNNNIGFFQGTFRIENDTVYYLNHAPEYNWDTFTNGARFIHKFNFNGTGHEYKEISQTLLADTGGTTNNYADVYPIFKDKFASFVLTTDWIYIHWEYNYNDWSGPSHLTNHNTHRIIRIARDGF